jgi:hypothetical protein
MVCARAFSLAVLWEKKPNKKQIHRAQCLELPIKEGFPFLIALFCPALFSPFGGTGVYT